MHGFKKPCNGPQYSGVRVIFFFLCKRSLLCLKPVAERFQLAGLWDVGRIRNCKRAPGCPCNFVRRKVAYRLRSQTRASAQFALVSTAGQCFIGLWRGRPLGAEVATRIACVRCHRRFGLAIAGTIYCSFPWMCTAMDMAREFGTGDLAGDFCTIKHQRYA